METMFKTSADYDALVKSIHITEDVRTHVIARDFEVSPDELVGKFCNYWKLGKPILTFIKIITPKQVDRAIDQIVPICDKLCKSSSSEEQSTLLENFAPAWIMVKPVLEGVRSITGPKADQIIDELIRIGDLLCIPTTIPS